MSDTIATVVEPLQLPQPEEVSKKERDDAMGAYFMTFATLAFGFPLPFLSLIASTIYHFVNASKSRFVAFHCLQALIAGIPVTLLNAGTIIWGIVLVGSHSGSNFDGVNLAPFWLLLIFTVIATLVFVIVSLYAAFQSRKGRFVYLWLVGPLVYRHYFVIGKGAPGKQDKPNLPPKGL